MGAIKKFKYTGELNDLCARRNADITTVSLLFWGSVESRTGPQQTSEVVQTPPGGDTNGGEVILNAGIDLTWSSNESVSSCKCL